MIRQRDIPKARNFVAKNDFNRASTHKIKKGKGSYSRKNKHKCLDSQG